MSDNTPWTPGPWLPVRYEIGSRVFWVVVSRDGRLPETEGNATVQAAAPEMAELLAAWLKNNGDYASTALCDQTRALLARIGTP